MIANRTILNNKRTFQIQVIYLIIVLFLIKSKFNFNNVKKGPVAYNIINFSAP